MKGSLEKPRYKVTIVDKGGTKYDVRKVITGFSISHQENDLAMSVTLTLANVKVGSKWLKDIIQLRNTVYVSYDIGGGFKEKFRGYVWKKQYTSDQEKEIHLVCYDNLIYLQKSTDSFYFSSGISNGSVIDSICKKWGVKLSYGYDTITMPKIPDMKRKNIADCIIEVLDETKAKTGSRYKIYSEKGTLCIRHAGKNSTIYCITQKKNVEAVDVLETLDGLVTKVVITGTSDNKDSAEPILATVNGKTAEYGTLQEMISKSKDTSLEDAKKEADQILKDKGEPEKSRRLRGVIDNPAISRGDKIKVNTDALKGEFIVKSIEHDPMRNKMDIEVY